MNCKCINVSKKPLRPKFGFSGVHWQKLEKRGFFHSPIFHITCIIRNVYHFKNRPFSLLPRCGFRNFKGSAPSLPENSGAYQMVSRSSFRKSSSETRWSGMQASESQNARSSSCVIQRYPVVSPSCRTTESFGTSVTQRYP